jgi:apolipoprotein N-acyltransferase
VNANDPRPTAREDAPAPSRPGTLLAALGMLVWVGAFAPQPQVLCTVPGVVCWLLLVERCRTVRQVLGWTFLFGALAIGFGYRWMAQTVQDFGGIPPAGAWALTAVFGAAGILHGWVFALFHRGMLSRGRRPHPLLTVALIVACEHLPIRVFPWKVGHGAVDVPPLLQAAEWGGVSAVTFALLCLVVPIHEWLRWAFARSGPPARPGAALATFLVGLALYGFGHVRYRAVLDEEAAAARSLRVGIVQPDVGSTAKRQAERVRGEAHRRSVDAYERGSRKAAAQGAELILWPETAITLSTPLMLPKHDPHVTNGFLADAGYRFLLELGAEHAFLVGMYERIPGRQRLDGGSFDERYNTAALREIGGRDAPWSVYRKVYLIPFGEYLPLPLDPKKYLPQNFTMKPGSTEGEARAFSSMLSFKGLAIAPFLCYEGILPEHVRSVCDGRRPDLLVSLTNDSWFGDTWEPHQHLNFTRFRAVEHRAPLVRATNTGISAFVSATGDVDERDRLGVGVEDVLVRDVRIVARGPTVYARFGHWFPWLMALVALLGWFSALLRLPPIVSPPAR